MYLKLFLGILSSIVLISSLTSAHSQEPELLNDTFYLPPLKQVKNGIMPEDVKCNKDKVLFFKISNSSPVCVFEKSIDKLPRSFMSWSGSHLIDYGYISDKTMSFTRTLLFEVDQTNENAIIITKIIDIGNFDKKSIVLSHVVENPDDVTLHDSLSANVIDYGDPRYHVLNYDPWTTREANSFVYSCESDEVPTLHLLPQGTQVILPLIDDFSGTEIFNDDDVVPHLKNTELDNLLHYTFSDFYETNFSVGENILLQNVTKQTCIFTNPVSTYDRLFTYDIFLEYEN